MISVPDTIFPSNNPEQIPVLLLEYQAALPDMPFKAWGSQGRKIEMRGTWHFYVDDYRFRALWSRPGTIVDTGCVSVVEPNFSIRDQTPYPVALWRIYKKRWLARYWQSHGISIIADLCVSQPFLELNMLGIPSGWKSYATRGYTDRLDLLDYQYALATERAGTEVISFIVYGGGRKVKEYCHAHPIILHIDEHREIIKPKQER